MMKKILAGLICLCGLLGFNSAVVADELISNGGFEQGAYYSEGVLPTDWVQVSAAVPGADTWPIPFNHFSGVSAHEGTRWVAAYANNAGYQESFGQYLKAPLVAGQQYTLSTYLHQSSYWLSGGYGIYLASSISVPGVFLGTLDATTNVTEWQHRTLTFVAPESASNLLVFAPYGGPTGSYTGIDAVSLSTVPEPASLIALLGGVISLLGVARRRL